MIKAFKLWLLGRLMVWFAKQNHVSEEDIDSGLTVVSVNELRNNMIEIVAPSNRQQKRAMAKRAGAIKDWKELNS